jgi:hypothetical protein
MALAADRLERAGRDPLHLGEFAGLKLGRADEVDSRGIQVLRLEVVEVPPRDDDLPDDARRAAVATLEHAALDHGPTTACSTSTVPSSAKAVSSAASSSDHVTPSTRRRSNPARAGLTNAGRPSARMRRSHRSRSWARPARVTVTHGTTGTPAAFSTCFVVCLSMPIADMSSPAPTYGRSSSSRKPWIVPSSPKRPCRIGKTTSMSPSERMPSASATRSSRDRAESGHRMRVPLSTTSGRCRGRGRTCPGRRLRARTPRRA